jgi:hypothetical protein
LFFHPLLYAFGFIMLYPLRGAIGICGMTTSSNAAPEAGTAGISDELLQQLLEDKHKDKSLRENSVHAHLGSIPSPIAGIPQASPQAC